MRKLLMALVRGYRFFLSPWLGSVCRFTPTCSAYALQALEQHGAAAGSYLTLRRLGRCHPWCAGGHDPVPALFAWRACKVSASEKTSVSSEGLRHNGSLE